MVKSIFSFIFEIIQTVVLAAAIFVVMYLFVVQPNMIRGASMEKSFFDGEYILTEKVSYRLREPQRGEVIVFRAPNRPDVDYIKRIIALPQETVLLQSGRVYVNGEPLDETYESADIRTTAGSFLMENKPYTVPSDSYFVLGDNRPHSSDSREFGVIEKNDIVGRAIWRYWPLSELGVVSTPSY